MTETTDKFYFKNSEEAEAAFYSAFEMADKSLMHAVVADQNVSCIHPNAMPIIGREAVLKSWDIILSNIDAPVLLPEVLHRSIEGDDVGNTAIHIVAELIAADHQLGALTALVIATNVYIKQDNGWRMMLHHTSLPSLANEETIENDPSITHSAPATMQ